MPGKAVAMHLSRSAAAHQSSPTSRFSATFRQNWGAFSWLERKVPQQGWEAEVGEYGAHFHPGLFPLGLHPKKMGDQTY